MTAAQSSAIDAAVLALEAAPNHPNPSHRMHTRQVTSGKMLYEAEIADPDLHRRNLLEMVRLELGAAVTDRVHQSEKGRVITYESGGVDLFRLMICAGTGDLPGWMTSGNSARSYLSDTDISGETIHVTTLADSGAGSLRDALGQSGARNIVFDVSGNIELQSRIDVVNGDVTVDGSTAPNGGVCIKDFWINIMCSNFVIRHVRIRPNLTDAVRSPNACLLAWDSSKHILIEHCSISWAQDDMVALFGTDVEMRYCIISEALTGTGKSLNVWHGGDNTKSVYIHHNLIALGFQRNPKFVMDTDGYCQFANNVIYGCKHNAVIDAAGATQYIDIVKNKWVSGPPTIGYEVQVWDAATPGASHAFLDGNIGWHRATDSGDENLIVKPEDLDLATYLPSPTESIPDYITDAETAYADVLTNAGATLPRRDAVDTRIIDSVQNGTGALISDPAEVGGYPDLTV